ncbi:uncharacterized protein LOC135202784 [Macrobrachium nipponense]|uniref:uncharacterized protein LOC135202784 n=1 Tax=Macrobrachium nipponense TaxID=159736 RepID=UPI0030C7CFC4
MTTITLGIGSVAAAGAVAAVAAGAVGLGLAAVANLFGERNRHYYHGVYRGRRQAQEPDEEVEEGKSGTGEEDESVALERLLDLIRSQDVTGCGLRLMCDLANRNENELDALRLGILNLVEPLPKPGEGILPSGGAGDYKMSRFHGQSGEDCFSLYPSCPLS